MNNLELADYLIKEVDKNRIVDVGSGVAKSLGVKQTELDRALISLEKCGYSIRGVVFPRVDNSEKIMTAKVLCLPDVTAEELRSWVKH